jgi:hypothetical protein
MKNIPAALKAELESQAFVQSLLVHIDIAGSNFRFTSWDSPLVFTPLPPPAQADLYSPRGIELSNISYGSANIVDNVRISFDDVDKSLYAVFGDNDAGDYPITLTLVVLDSAGSVASFLNIFRGSVDQWKYKPGKIDIVAASVFAQWAQVTTSKFSGSCRWKVFKGPYCKYTGSGIVCDRTYDQCDTYGNAENFGGFRWLPSLVAKRISL